MASRCKLTAEDIKSLVDSLAKEATAKWQEALLESGKPPAEVDRLLQDHLEYQRQRNFLEYRGLRRWLVDLLSENGEITLHRFQMLAWTLGLGLVFVTAVIGNLTMPDFPSTVLALMGLSAGAYLGFRIPEADPVVKTLTSSSALDHEARMADNLPSSPANATP